jgi:hypothetical protein
LGDLCGGNSRPAVGESGLDRLGYPIVHTAQTGQLGRRLHGTEFIEDGCRINEIRLREPVLQGKESVRRQEGHFHADRAFAEAEVLQCSDDPFSGRERSTGCLETVGDPKPVCFDLPPLAYAADVEGFLDLPAGDADKGQILAPPHATRLRKEVEVVAASEVPDIVPSAGEEEPQP